MEINIKRSNKSYITTLEAGEFFKNKNTGSVYQVVKIIDHFSNYYVLSPITPNAPPIANRVDQGLNDLIKMMNNTKFTKIIPVSFNFEEA